MYVSDTVDVYPVSESEPVSSVSVQRVWLYLSASQQWVNKDTEIWFQQNKDLWDKMVPGSIQTSVNTVKMCLCG